jgi:hypothetical protein
MSRKSFRALRDLARRAIGTGEAEHELASELTGTAWSCSC